MSKSIFAKVAAVACSVATLGALGIAASAQKNTEVADRKDLVDGKTNIIAGIVEAEAGETVKFPVYIANNSKDGFAATGLRLFYDDMLTPTLKEDGMPNAIKGEACDAVITKFSHNAEKHIIGLDTMGDEPETDNGQMFPGNLIVPYFNENAFGLKTIDGMDTIVSAGTGYYGPPMRLGTDADITVINITFQ